MNRKINHRRFRVYPKVGSVPEAPVAPSLAGVDDMLLEWSFLKLSNYVDAGRCTQCSPTNGHQEVDEVVVRESPEVEEVVVRESSGSRGCSRSGHQEVVVREQAVASRRSRKM